MTGTDSSFRSGRAGGRAKRYHPSPSPRGRTTHRITSTPAPASSGAALLGTFAGADVWRFCLDVAEAELEAWGRCLSGEERARSERIHPRVRKRRIAAWVCMRGILGTYLGTSPEAVPISVRPDGKPALACGPMFNLSHSEAMGLLAVSAQREVGVDVELLRPVPEADAIVSRWVRPGVAEALPPHGPERDAAFLALWTRREAVLKGLGVGLSGADEVGPAEEARWMVVDLSPGSGYVGALAVKREAG